MLHEGLGSIAQWRSLPERLHTTTGLPILAYDRPGYGASRRCTADGERVPHVYAPDFMSIEATEVLPTLLRQLGVDDVILVGHSDGGTIALLAAAAIDNLGVPIRGVAVIAAHTHVEAVCVQGIRAAGLGRDRIIEGLGRYHDDPGATFDAWHDIWLSPDFASWSILEQLAQVTCPVLALQGAHDEYATESMLHGIGSGVSDPHVVELIPGCGHIAHRDQPDIVLDRLNRFVTSIA
jgi:pimeloyl-ACP methyl ester carboxylesterase